MCLLVSPLPSSAIVDTNGAGDMFAGGYLGAVVLGKSTDEAVEIGHKLGAMCVGQVSAAFIFEWILVSCTDWVYCRLARNSSSPRRTLFR